MENHFSFPLCLSCSLAHLVKPFSGSSEQRHPWLPQSECLHCLTSLCLFPQENSRSDWGADCISSQRSSLTNYMRSRHGLRNMRESQNRAWNAFFCKAELEGRTVKQGLALPLTFLVISTVFVQILLFLSPPLFFSPLLFWYSGKQILILFPGIVF